MTLARAPNTVCRLADCLRPEAVVELILPSVSNQPEADLGVKHPDTSDGHDVIPIVCSSYSMGTSSPCHDCGVCRFGYDGK